MKPRLTCYGGVGEIGGNKLLLEDRDTKVMLDFGTGFSDGVEFFDGGIQPRGVNGAGDLFEFGLLPQIRGFYSEKALQNSPLKHVPPEVDAVVLSHYHWDHMGRIEHVDPEIPVYCGETTSLIHEANSGASSSPPRRPRTQDLQDRRQVHGRPLGVRPRPRRPFDPRRLRIHSSHQRGDAGVHGRLPIPRSRGLNDRRLHPCRLDLKARPSAYRRYARRPWGARRQHERGVCAGRDEEHREGEQKPGPFDLQRERRGQNQHILQRRGGIRQAAGRLHEDRPSAGEAQKRQEVEGSKSWQGRRRLPQEEKERRARRQGLLSVGETVHRPRSLRARGKEEAGQDLSSSRGLELPRAD